MKASVPGGVESETERAENEVWKSATVDRRTGNEREEDRGNSETARGP